MSERRHDLGLTQRDVVDRLESLGLATSNRTLSAMEHGQGVDVGRLPELAAALDCTVTYLLGLTADPRCWVPDDPVPAAGAAGAVMAPAAAAFPARMAGPSVVSCAICADHAPEAGHPAGNGHRGA